jgi:hypothetical protein
MDLIIGIFLFHPTIANYPKAKFPGVVVFSEIYQGGLEGLWMVSNTVPTMSRYYHFPVHSYSFITPQ